MSGKRGKNTMPTWPEIQKNVKAFAADVMKIVRTNIDKLCTTCKAQSKTKKKKDDEA